MSHQQPQQSDGRSTSSSSEIDLDDLDCLNFPGEVDWSSTLVLRCEPGAGPYKLADVTNTLHELVRRNEVFTLGPTTLNHVFTLSFKSTYALEGFCRFMQKKKLNVKGRPCIITRVPDKCVTVYVRNVPVEVDSVHIVNVLKTWGTVVKTELVKSKFRGWFHVYTNERKFSLLLHSGVTVQDLPYGVNVKGLIGSVSVDQRDPKCLECFYSGHVSDSCELKGCILYRG